MKYKINVTKADIKNGEPGNCDSCAISHALRRKFKTMNVRTEVDAGDIVIKVNDKKYEVNHMQENDVLDFIDTFDNYQDYLSLGDTEFVDPKPINFEIIERS